MTTDLTTFPCFVISEDTPDRARFWALDARRPSPWPFAMPELYPAVWGARTDKPANDPRPAGAWGCWRTHCRLWEDVFSRGLPGAVVFEDDACFRNFDALPAFLASVPADWDMIYLGGQHLSTPRQAGPVQIGVNINRTHAYILRATDRTRAAYHRLCDMTPAAGKNPHVDYVLGSLHESGALTAYCPPEWFCGQAAGESTITGKTTGERYW